jgi:hypothetical protein
MQYTNLGLSTFLNLVGKVKFPFKTLHKKFTHTHTHHNISVIYILCNVCSSLFSFQLLSLNIFLNVDRPTDKLKIFKFCLKFNFSSYDEVKHFLMMDTYILVSVNDFFLITTYAF